MALVGLIIPGPAGAAPPGAHVTRDPTGDTVDDMGVTAGGQPSADIVEASARWAAGQLELGLSVQTPTDPRTDPHWDEATYVVWAIDTTGDDDADYAVFYARDDGQLVAEVSRTSEPPQAPPACHGAPGTAADGSYTVGVPASCLGNPAAVRYGALIRWDSDPRDEEAPVISDMAPNGEALSGPVAP